MTHKSLPRSSGIMSLGPRPSHDSAWWDTKLVDGRPVKYPPAGALLRAVVHFSPLALTGTKMKYWHFNKEVLFSIDLPSLHSATAATHVIRQVGETDEEGRERGEMEVLQNVCVGGVKGGGMACGNWSGISSGKGCRRDWLQIV